jgi:hypothetical protein
VRNGSVLSLEMTWVAQVYIFVRTHLESVHLILCKFASNEKLVNDLNRKKISEFQR